MLVALSFLVPLLIAPGPATLFSISRTGAVLRVIDPATGATVDDSITITLPVETVAGGNGLATHPQTGEPYALVRTAEGFPTDRKLVRIDRTTGAATSIGNTGDRFAGLAFDSSGTLYAVTGDGAATPETLYTLSLIDATATFVTSLGNGGDGEAIAFNPSDGFLYHASGVDDGINDSRILEKIDLISLTVTNIPLSGDGYSEIAALTFSGASFFGTDTLGPFFLSVTDGGAVDVIGTMDHVSRGLAFGPSVPAVPALDRWGQPLLVIALLAVALVALGVRRARTA